MIDVKGDSYWFSITKSSNYSNGQPGVDVYISAGSQLTNLQAQVNSVTNQVNALLEEQRKERLARETNPALKEAYEHYQMTYAIVKDR